MIHFSPCIRFGKSAAFFLTLLSWFLFSGMNSWSQTTCDTWLYVHGDRSGVETNGPSITGNQLTVEALFNRTQPFDPIGQGGDLVSKHGDPTDVNYLLRPYSAQITTDQGFFAATDPNGANSISPNVTYHVAMVYNGYTLSLYRNGILIQQVPASGNLVTNTLPVHIGTEGYLQTIWPVHFYGYINEVRIWNAARSQTDIQTYMNTLLPNPTSTPGLQAYYTFNSTANKVNNAYSGFVIGDAEVHQANPNAVSAICENDVASSCNTFLQIHDVQSGVSIGDLDITGDQLTVEAVFNTEVYDAAYSGGDLVSKHCDPTDVNYLLRPNQVSITTTNGFYNINAPCSAEVGITYYVALVYNGASLKFYRNWELLGEIPASGDLITNDWPAKIGWEGCSTTIPIDFKGYINEVRIWNIARATNDLMNFYRTVLPNPTSTPGLQAYYTFNSLQNKQGNSTWDGSLFGNATINETLANTNCIPENGYEHVCGWYRRDVSTATTPAKETVPEQSLLTGELIMYPNPAKGTVKLAYNAANNNTVTIKVIDVTGKTSLIMNRAVITGKNTITANVSNLTNGIYFVQFINGSSVQTKKLVINK
jgi:hypothetical protein